MDFNVDSTQESLQEILEEMKLAAVRTVAMSRRRAVGQGHAAGAALAETSPKSPDLAVQDTPEPAAQRRKDVSQRLSEEVLVGRAVEGTVELASPPPVPSKPNHVTSPTSPDPESQEPVPTPAQRASMEGAVGTAPTAPSAVASSPPPSQPPTPASPVQPFYTPCNTNTELPCDPSLDIDIFLAELGLTDQAAAQLASELTPKQPVYLLTSLAGGGFHMPSRTNRLQTILTANNVPFRLRDAGTDPEALRAWKRQANGRTLPAVMLGSEVVGNWQDVEEANEEWRVRTMCGLD